MTTANYIAVAIALLLVFVSCMAMVFRLHEEIRLLKIENRWHKVQLDILRDYLAKRH